ncbi:DUF7594 domain-containing protein [Propionibacteriaceae bacterium Y2011]
MQRRTLLGGLLAGTTVGVAASSSFPWSAFAKPSPQQLLAEIRSTHPRLLLTDFEAVRRKLAENETIRGWFDTVQGQADAILLLPPYPYTIPDGLRLNTAPTLTRSYVLGLVYGVTEGAEYRDRLWAELSQAAEWKDWNPRHFLDTASMTHAFAIGHDWAHQGWDDNQREVLRQAIVTLGLGPGLEEYESGAVWTDAAHNWNTVCNSGLSMGALSVADTDPTIAGSLLTKALEAIPIAIEQYGPDGGFPEGATYWRYSTEYLVTFMAALMSASGSAQGLDTKPGMAQTNWYPITMTGPSDNTFNYYDAGLPSPHSPEEFWLGAHYGNPIFTYDATVRAAEHPQPKDIIWIDPSHDTGRSQLLRSPLDKAWSAIHVTSSRASWADPLGSFVAAKGGANNAHHGDNDLGTFVLENQGHRWAVDLGPDDYNLYGYFHYDEGQMRWNYYRKRAEGHNTVVFAPDARQGQAGQAWDGTGTVLALEHGVREAITILDLDAAAPEKATAWRRGLWLFDNRRQLLLRDEFTLRTAADAWWFWHTDADVDVAADGLSCTLSHGSNRMLLRLIGDDLPANARFFAAAAEPLWASPTPNQTPNTGVTKLVVWARDVTTAAITVQASAVSDSLPIPPVAAARALRSWRLGPKPTELADAVTLDDEPLPDFVPGVLNYTVVRPEGSTPPVVAATVARGRVTVTQASAVPGVATIRIGGGGSRAIEYHVRFETSVGLSPGVVVLVSTHDGNVGENTLDGDLSTRWSAQGAGQWIRYDLGAVVQLDSVQIAFWQGNVRTTRFTLEVSDGGPWRRVYGGQSLGTTNELETFRFEVTTARYVRFTGMGNSANDWNSLTEFTVPGHELAAPTPPVRLSTVTVSGTTFVPIGGTTVLTASAANSDGTASPGATIRWATADGAVAGVTDDGVVHGRALGTTVLGAVATSVDGHMAWAGQQVTVHDPAETYLACTADTYVQGGASADRSFGDALMLLAKTDPVNAREAFIGFDAVDVGDAAQLGRAELRVRVEVSDGAGSTTDMAVHAVLGDWQESTLTWNSRPTVGAALDTQYADGAADLAFDVTDAVRDALSSGTPLSFCIRQVPETPGGPGRYTTMPSRESGHGAMLVVRGA